MCVAKLKEALNDCLISFDCRVLLTDLINEYHMPLGEVSKVIIDYCNQQENDGVEYEKRFVVHGLEPEDPNKEVFKIVKSEEKLQWLKKLQNAESALYSVEKVGGSKSPAEDLKPVKWCAVKIDRLETRTISSKHTNSNATKEAEKIKATVKEEPKPENKQAIGIAGAFAKAKASDTTKAQAKNEDEATTSKGKISADDNEKSSPQDGIKKEENVGKSPQKTDSKKPLPKEKKATAAAVGQKGIGNFFAPKGKGAVDASKKSETQKSPKKLNDFFKKQIEKSGGDTKLNKEMLKHEEKKINTSVQLFDNEDEADVEQKQKEVPKETSMEVVDESSDEEEELNKLRRKVEAADQVEEAATSSRKRLRIEDSDDEDEHEAEDVDEQEPQQKQGKLDKSASVTEIVDSQPKSETYLDEDGFVITVKSKKSHAKSDTKSNARQKTPTKTSPKSNKPKQTPTPASKAKQGNIMNFFKKK